MKKISILLFAIFNCFLIFSSDKDQESCNKVLYVHGFTGNPDGWKTLVPAILPDSEIIAPALPDTKTVKGIGFNKLIQFAASFWGKNVNRVDSDLGNDKDIKSIVKCIPNKPFIAWGICRGGTALINTIAKHNPEHLKALVIEASYVSCPKILYGLLSSYGVSTKHAESFAKFLFPAYKIGTASCNDSIANIKNKDLPILIIHSRDDTIIPYQHALMLYKSFKKNGFNHVYLAIVGGKHAYSLQEDEANYLKAVHSFYKKYNLPYDQKYAQDDVLVYQPTIASVTRKINAYYDEIKKQIKRNQRDGINLGVGKLIVLASLMNKED